MRGTSSVPRLYVFRSNKYLYAQIIDDETGRVIVGNSGKKTVKDSFSIGETIAKRAADSGIEKVIFDRGGYKYHGRIKALADGARRAGLKF